VSKENQETSTPSRQMSEVSHFKALIKNALMRTTTLCDTNESMKKYKEHINGDFRANTTKVKERL
jgi:hypothetical protein